MIKVAVWSQKGGVGKSTVTALLGLSLRDMGKKLGLLDVDLSGSSLYKALGLQSPPRFRTSTYGDAPVLHLCSFRRRECGHVEG